MAVQTTEEFKNGGATSYSITIEYLQASDIKVRIGGVLQTYVSSNPSSGEYTVSGTTVTLGAQAASGTGNVHIYRETDVNTAAATFAAGSSIRASDLNAIHDMARFAAVEHRNKIITANIKAGAVTTTEIKDGTILTADIGADQITNALIADDQIDSEHYVDASIDHQHLSNDCIDGDNIQDDVINSEHYVAGSIDHEHLATDIIDGDNIQDDVINSEHYVAGSIDHEHLANDIIDGDNIQDNAINSEHYVDGSIDHVHLSNDCVDEDNIQDDAVRSEHIQANAVTDSEIATGTLDNRYYTEAELNGGQLNNLYFTESEITGGAADGRYYTETELNNGQLDNRYYTETELNAGQLDNRYFTETEADGRFLRQDSTDVIDTNATWTTGNTHVATTGAIEARIIDLIDDVGGFTAIANETSFPTTNPQGSTGQAAILSIAAVSTTLTPNNSNVITIANGAGSGNTVTITGVTPSSIPTGFGLLVQSTSTTHTYTFHRLVPKALDVNTVSTNITNIVAAGANVVDINNFADLYQISNNAPTQRADGSALQDGDLWFDNSNDNLRVYDGTNWAIVTPAQSVLDNIAIVSGAITYSEDLGLITDAVATGSSNGSLDIVADTLEDEITFTVTAATGKFIIDGVDKPALTLYKGWTYTFDVSDASNATHPLRFQSGGSAYSTNVTVTGTQGQAGAKVQIVIPESQPTSFQYYCTSHSGMGNTITVKDDPIKTVSDNVTNIVAVANNSSNINSVHSNATNINAVQANASNINAAVSNASNINSAVSNATNINTVAGSISNVNSVGSNISNVNSVHGNASNINSAVSNATNINSVAGSISNVNTVASNISNVNSFAGTYQIANSNPSTDGAGNTLAAGDLYFNTGSNELRVYNGSSWQGGVTATGNLAGLGANTFSGNQTINANIIVSGTVDGRDVATDGTKLDGIEANATADQTASEIVSLISGQTIAPNVITTTNLTLDFGTL
jgi:hypothetical protein